VLKVDSPYLVSNPGRRELAGACRGAET
jgi:hypothetical protein